GCSSYGVHALHSLSQQLMEHGVVAALILATENQVNVRGERFERLDGGIYIRGFGVVVVIHACEPGHELQPVLDGFENSDSMADLFGLATDEDTDRNSRQRVFQIVRSFQRYFGQRHDFAFAMAIPEIDMRAANKGSFFNRLFSAEPEQLRAGALRQSSGSRIIGIEDGEIIRPLVLEDARLGVDVIDKSLVAIKVVGRDVQNHRDPRAKLNNRLQLKA